VPTDDLVTIGTFSLLSGLSVSSLRHYDEMGILPPAEVDARTGYRRYRRDQLDRARRVRALRAVDLPLDDVRAVVDADDGDGRAVLAAHRDRLTERLSGLVRELDRYLEEGCEVEAAQGFRPVELNVGVRDLDEAVAFYEAVFAGAFERTRAGASLRFGAGDSFFLLNLRRRGDDEPHRDHVTAFGFLVDDLEATHDRALAAGATEQFPPSDSPTTPRCSRFADTSGNRVVLYQA
jgi:DNA-binding transcriptional MerR regulator